MNELTISGHAEGEALLEPAELTPVAVNPEHSPILHPHLPKDLSEILIFVALSFCQLRQKQWTLKLHNFINKGLRIKFVLPKCMYTVEYVRKINF